MQSVYSVCAELIGLRPAPQHAVIRLTEGE